MMRVTKVLTSYMVNSSSRIGSSALSHPSMSKTTNSVNSFCIMRTERLTRSFIMTRNSFPDCVVEYRQVILVST